MAATMRSHTFIRHEQSTLFAIATTIQETTRSPQFGANSRIKYADLFPYITFDPDHYPVYSGPSKSC